MVLRCVPEAESLTHVGQAVVDQVAYELVRGTVVGEPALVARCDEAHSSQQRELVTRDGQREIERPREVPDRQLVVRQRMHEREPNGVREEPEDLRGLPEHPRGRETVPGRTDLLGTDHFG